MEQLLSQTWNEREQHTINNGPDIVDPGMDGPDENNPED